MKKQLLIIAAFTLIAASISAQQAAKINGQPFGQGDWFGSNNNEAVTFKANNNVGFKIKPNGEVVLKSLDLNSSIGPNGLVLTDGQGKLFRLNFPNDASKVLLGDGTFGVLPFTPQWLSSGNNLYWNAGNVSIGSVPNSFKLKVEGDVRVSHDLFVNNNMYVGGGIVISDKIQGVTEVKGWDFKVENDIQVTGTSRFNGATQLDQTLAVIGDATFENSLTAKKGIMFDNVNGIRYIPATPTSGAKYSIGGVYSPLTTSCLIPNNSAVTQTPGFIQSRMSLGNGTGLVNSALTFGSAPWDGSGIIEVEGSDASGGGTNGLLVNYFCGRDIALCTGTGTGGGAGTAGGFVFTGPNVQIGNPYPSKDATVALNVGSTDKTTFQLQGNFSSASSTNYVARFFTNRSDANVLTVFDNANNFVRTFNVSGNGATQIVSTSATNSPLTINNNTLTSPNKTVFEVKPNGKTQIGFETANLNSAHQNAMLTVSGEVVAKAVYVTQLNWADYVFEKDYSLPTLENIEMFYLKNKHLPGVPSEKEVNETGINVADMDATLLKKIEELTIYLVKINKELIELKEKNNALQGQVNLLTTPKK